MICTHDGKQYFIRRDTKTPWVFVFTCLPLLFADSTRKGGGYGGGGSVNDMLLPHRLLFADPQNAGPAPRVKYFCSQRRRVCVYMTVGEGGGGVSRAACEAAVLSPAGHMLCRPNKEKLVLSGRHLHTYRVRGGVNL